MSEEETSTVEETTTEEAPVEEAPAEVVPEPVVETALEPSTADDKSSEISGSIGTGKQVFSGACKLCGARVASGPVNKEGKVHCLTCKGDF